jgi:periplasmic protein TonB
MTSAQPTAVVQQADATAAPRSGAPATALSSSEVTWEQMIQARLESAKRYPGDAQRRGMEDVIYLRFTVDRQGKVLASSIERSQGYSSLDSEVLALIQRASPLPPPPEQVAGQAIEMVVPVQFFLRHHG